MTVAATSSASTATTALASGTSNATTDNTTTATQDRFLKLLVAQLTNQDPMNPMDNAAMTTQMAQINTVNGIEQLNTTMTSMLTQIGSLQTMQGASLTGHDVMVTGSQLTKNTDGTFSGSFSLDAAAESVTVEVLSPGGQSLDKINLGAQTAGRQDFSWDNSSYASTNGAPTFKVTATAGGQALTSTTLMRGTVQSVSTVKGALQLDLKNIGTVPYANVVSVM